MRHRDDRGRQTLGDCGTMRVDEIGDSGGGESRMEVLPAAIEFQLHFRSVERDDGEEVDRRAVRCFQNFKAFATDERLAQYPADEAQGWVQGFCWIPVGDGMSSAQPRI